MDNKINDLAKDLEELNESPTSQNSNNEDTVEKTHSDELAELKIKIEQQHDKFLRAAAESENARKRYEKMIDEAKEYAIVNFCKDLIGIMDNLKRALEHKPSSSDAEIKNFISGIELTSQEFKSIFKKHGLESIEPEPGEKFNYNLHHALSQIMTDQYNPDTIVSTMQIGYKIRERLLRPAIVTVSKKLE